MPAIIRPDTALRWTEAWLARADSHMCWTCKTCVTECPVNIATNRLSPVKMVRMTSLGLLEEMVLRPEIWYCIACRRCVEVCPMTVKPFMIMDFLRGEAVRSGIIAATMLQHRRDLIKRLQRARWFVARDAIAGNGASGDTSGYWYRCGQMPIEEDDDTIRPVNPGPFFWRPTGEKPNISACLTCGECCSVCPAFYEGDVFNPMKILRMAVLGMVDQLLVSPSIWVCMDCGQCTAACSQRLSIHRMIRTLQRVAVEKGRVHPYFAVHFQERCKGLFRQFIQAMDDALEYEGLWKNRFFARPTDPVADRKRRVHYDCVA